MAGESSDSPGTHQRLIYATGLFSRKLEAQRTKHIDLGGNDVEMGIGDPRPRAAELGWSSGFDALDALTEISNLLLQPCDAVTTGSLRARRDVFQVPCWPTQRL